jgi:hypothetical protein
MTNSRKKSTPKSTSKKSGEALTKQALETIDENLARIDATEPGEAPAATAPEVVPVENAKPAKGKKDKGVLNSPSQ